MKLILVFLFLLFTGYCYSQTDTLKESTELPLDKENRAGNSEAAPYPKDSNSGKYLAEEAPVALNLGEVRASIQYPDSARINMIEGRVTIKVLVGQDGNIMKVGEFTGPKVFYEEIVNAAYQLKFTPGLINGEPIKCWVVIPFNFKLNKKPPEDDTGK